MRKKFIAGNWKMNKTPEEAIIYIEQFKKLISTQDIDVGLCVSYIDLFACLKYAEGTGIKIIAENMHELNSGAFTGEVSPVMLNSIGIEYVLIGHSERRQHYNETDEKVNLKLKAAFANNLLPIVCVGDEIEQRNNGTYREHILNQVKIALEGLTAQQVSNVIIAYEPIWAISTSGIGQVATKEDANEVCGFIRKYIEENYRKEIAEEIRILYGGSMKPSNAKELLNMEEIDGGLVGGASLKPEDFAGVVNYNI